MLQFVCVLQTVENFSIPFGKPHFNTDILKRKQVVSGSGLINTGVFVDVDNVENVKKIVKGAEISSFFEKKYPQPERKVFHVLAVDNVDKLSGKQAFADIYNISGSHSYQQVTVDTIF